MQEHKIGIIGLGYVGLPLAVLFAKKYSVIGYDINESRVSELKNCVDRTKELEDEELSSVLKNGLGQVSKKETGLSVTSYEDDLSKVNTFIITVPTPITEDKKPDLSLIESSCKTISMYLKMDDVVILESTVYPGVTEEFCAPLLENLSGLKYNHDFFMGYSPERVNPGDKVHRIENIIKVTSGSTSETADRVDSLYKSVVKAGTHKAPSIKVAEAAKAIENAQRDINIAFMNELKQIFDLMDIETSEVLSAARTKWNFLDFYPGLVGGHCIGVDPYYLSHKAQELRFNPKVILSGRQTNDEMPYYVVNSILEKLKENNINPKGSKILVLGLTFKPNVPDVRNSKTLEVIDMLTKAKCKVSVCEPLAHLSEIIQFKESIELINIKDLGSNSFDLVYRATYHDIFEELKVDAKLKYEIF